MNQQDDNGSNRGDDELVAGYRRASTREAGRPSAKMRAAILAEAAAANARRTRASNDPYYLWRGAAGIAVLGILGMLWKQVEQTSPRLALEPDAPVIIPQMPVQEPSPPQVAPAPQVESAAKQAQSSHRPAPAPPPADSGARPAPSAAPPAAPSPDPFPANQGTAARRAEQSSVPAASAAPPPLPPPAPPVSGPARAWGGAAPGAAGRGGGRGSGAPSSQAEELVRRHFPEQYLSDHPRRVWVVLNGTGEVVSSGELQEGQAYSDITDARARESADTSNRAGWTLETIRNARGQPVQIGISSPR